jgi:hypothetical protein
VIYWGTLGFSVRAHSPKFGGVTSFAYGYPPATFEVLLKNEWESNEDASAELRETLVSKGVFREAGQYTLRVTLTDQTMQQMDDIYDFLLNEVDRQVKAQSGP